jgi:chromosome segregation ATPase
MNVNVSSVAMSCCSSKTTILVLTLAFAQMLGTTHGNQLRLESLSNDLQNYIHSEAVAHLREQVAEANRAKERAERQATAQALELNTVKQQLASRTEASDATAQGRRHAALSSELASANARNKELLTELNALSDRFHDASKHLSAAQLELVNSAAALRTKERELELSTEKERTSVAEIAQLKGQMHQYAQQTSASEQEARSLKARLLDAEHQIAALQASLRGLQDTCDEQGLVVADYQVGHTAVSKLISLF